jgi:hypothetical protein
MRPNLDLWLAQRAEAKRLAVQLHARREAETERAAAAAFARVRPRSKVGLGADAAPLDDENEAAEGVLPWEGGINRFLRSLQPAEDHDEEDTSPDTSPVTDGLDLPKMVRIRGGGDKDSDQMVTDAMEIMAAANLKLVEARRLLDLGRDLHGGLEDALTNIALSDVASTSMIVAMEMNPSTIADPSTSTIAAPALSTTTIAEEDHAEADCGDDAHMEITDDTIAAEAPMEIVAITATALTTTGTHRSITRASAATSGFGAVGPLRKLVLFLWAQCDKCSKWRRLPPGREPGEDEYWECSMNPNRLLNTCSAAQEEMAENELAGNELEAVMRQRQLQQEAAAADTALVTPPNTLLATSNLLLPFNLSAVPVPALQLTAALSGPQLSVPSGSSTSHQPPLPVIKVGDIVSCLCQPTPVCRSGTQFKVLHDGRMAGDGCKTGEYIIQLVVPNPACKLNASHFITVKVRGDNLRVEHTTNATVYHEMENHQLFYVAVTETRLEDMLITARSTLLPSFPMLPPPFDLFQIDEGMEPQALAEFLYHRRGAHNWVHHHLHYVMLTFQIWKSTPDNSTSTEVRDVPLLVVKNGITGKYTRTSDQATKPKPMLALSGHLMAHAGPT